MADIIDLIDQLATDLKRGPSVIPLQRRIRNCSGQVEAIRELGYPIKALASDLANRGVTGQNGAAITYGHLRVLLSRGSRVTTSPRPATSKRGVEKRGSGAVIPHQAISRSKQSGRPDFSGGLFGDRFARDPKSRD